MLAASAGHAPTAELLLERRANANAVGNEGEMPLVVAAEAGHVAVVRELLYYDETLYFQQQGSKCYNHIS